MSKSWKVGMEVIAPGVYVDGKGSMHLDTAEMCLAAGYPPTRENQAMLEQVFFELFDGTVVVEVVKE